MRLVLVPPYRGAGYGFKPEEEQYYKDSINHLAVTGQLEGVTIGIDEGAHTNHTSDTRDETYFDAAAVSTLPRVKALAESGDVDGIIVLGTIDVGFYAMRTVSPIPVAFAMHSALHVASLIGDRCSVIEVTDPLAARARRTALLYGLGDKLVSVRSIGHSSTELSTLLRDSVEERLARPEVQTLLDDLATQARLAVEIDQADTLIITFTPFQSIADAIRARLDAEGLSEIQIVWPLSAAVAVAKAMVEMQLMPAKRAFPNDALANKPTLR